MEGMKKNEQKEELDQDEMREASKKRRRNKRVE